MEDSKKPSSSFPSFVVEPIWEEGHQNPPDSEAVVGTKRCPYCAEDIKQAAVVCRYCSRDLEDGRPARPSSARTIEKTSKDLKRQSIWAWVTLIVGVLVAATAVGKGSGSGLFNDEIRTNIGEGIGFMVFCVGLGWLLWVRHKIWWHHQ